MPYKSREERLACCREYHKKHKAEIKKRNKIKYQLNKDAIKQKSKEYYINNKEACVQYHKEYGIKNKEKIKEYSKQYNKAYALKNKERLSKLRQEYIRQHKNRYKMAIRRAALRNLTFTLTEKEYIDLITQQCYYCENKLGDTFNSRAGVGLDRIDNACGYELTNVVSCCEKCNIIRSNILTPEETKIAIQAVINYRNQTGNKNGPEENIL